MLGAFPLVVAYVVLAATPAPHDGVLSILRQVLYLAPFLACAVACGRLALILPAEERLFWALLGACIGFITLGEIEYSVRYVRFGTSSIPSLGFNTISVAIPAGIFMAILYWLSRLKGSVVATRLRFLTDLLIMVAAGGTLVQLQWIGPYFGATGIVDWPTQIMGTVHASIGLAGILGTGMLLFGLKGTAWRLWERLVIGGIAVYSFALFLWPVYFVQHFFTSGVMPVIVETLWMFGIYWIFIGTIARVEGETLGERLRRLPPFQVRARWVPFAFHALSLLFVMLMAVAAFRHYEGVDSVYALRAAVIVALLIVMRGFWVALEGGHLYERSSIDTVTGLYNHRYGQERLDFAVDMSVRAAESLSVLAIDVDDFRTLNAARGFGTGDRELQGVADAVRAIVSVEDLAFRVEGDEFAVVLAGVDHVAAMMHAERLRASIAGTSSVTVSIGVSTLPQDGTTGEAVHRAARIALAWSKRHGKNRVVAYDADRNTEGVVGTLDTGSELDHLTAVRVLASSVDAREVTMRHHSQAVSDLVWALARELRMAEDRAELLRFVAQVHDIGKIAVPDEILRKPTELTPGESAVLRDHPLLGERILSAAGLGDAARWVRSHHECWDGSGYPDGLRAAAIPVESRMLAICDAFDAMTSNRPYRRARQLSHALQEIDRCMGSQFDPEIAEAFIRMAAERFAVDPTALKLPEVTEHV